DSAEKREVLMALNVERREIRERLLTPHRIDRTRADQLSEGLSHFQVDDMRSMKRFSRHADQPIDRRGQGQVQDELDGGRGIQDDQRESRSSRMISAGEIRV